MRKSIKEKYREIKKYREKKIRSIRYTDDDVLDLNNQSNDKSVE